MNEQLQQALATILDKTMNGIDASVEFMQAELPDVIQQLLTWYMVKGIVFSVAGVILIFILIKIDMKVFKYAQKESYGDAFIFVMSYIGFGSIVRLVYLLPIDMINIEWLQIWIAPKIWLIEYAASLAK